MQAHLLHVPVVHGVVGHLVVLQLDDLLQLIVVAFALADDHHFIKQEYVPRRRSYLPGFLTNNNKNNNSGRFHARGFFFRAAYNEKLPEIKFDYNTGHEDSVQSTGVAFQPECKLPTETIIGWFLPVLFGAVDGCGHLELSVNLRPAVLLQLHLLVREKTHLCVFTCVSHKYFR